MIFHKHRWIKIKETYAEPRSDIRVKWVSSEFSKLLMFGLTTILWECEICHKIRKEEMLGKGISPLRHIQDQRIRPRMTATEIIEKNKEIYERT